MTTLLRGLSNPLPGERVLAVHPKLAPQVEDAQWRRRANFFTGRSVGEQALRAEQNERGARIALHGQLASPGVVSGLEAGVRQERSGSWTLEVAPGIGIASSGEDVRLTRPLSIPVNNLPVTLTRSGQVTTRTVGEWLTPGPNAEPFLALILVLEPIQIRRASARDPGEPCELSPEDIAFDDEQLIDGARLTVLDFPSAFSVQNPATDPPRWRNRLAYEIFQREAELAPGQALPWDGAGVGIGLLGIESQTAAPFVDVHAVAREGGSLRQGQPLVGSKGGAALWQARLRQFVDALEAIGLATLASQGLAARFGFLPPVGTLPASVLVAGADGVIPLDVRGDRGEPHLPLPRSPLFPAGYVLEAAPVELESLDDFALAAAGMTPFDLSRFDQLQVLVPVPQRYFSPDLLRVEDETPDEFREAIRLFLLRLSHRLGRRNDVRGAEQRLQLALFGTEPAHPRPDPEAVQGEADSRFPQDADLPDTDAIPPPEERYADDLQATLLAFGRRLAQLVKPTPFGVLLEQLRAENTNEAVRPVPVLDVLAAAARFVTERAGGEGLVGFVQGASKKLLAASEALDISFTRTANELYRVRSLVSGEAEATQLATSPALPFVMKDRLTAVTPVQLNTFKTFVLKPRDPNTPPRPPTTTPRVESKTARISGAEGVPAAFIFTRDIRQRITAPLVLDTRDGAERAKRAVFRTLLSIHDSGLSLDELDFPGFRVDPADDLTGPPPTEIPTIPDTGLVVRQVNLRWVRRFIEFFDTPPAGAQPYWPHDPETSDDEGSIAATAINSIEQAIAALRIAEGRLAAFDRALTLTRERMNAELATFNRVQLRLEELGDEIEQFRSDVLIARALEQEEIARARRVNAERNQVLREHVPFVVFRRPRTIDTLLAGATHVAAPAILPDPVPACLNGDFEAPDQLRGMVDLLRDAPLVWSSFGTNLLPRINRTSALQQIAVVALHRAANPHPYRYDPFATSAFADGTGQQIRRVYEGQRQAIIQLRSPRMRFDAVYFFRYSWVALVPLLLPVVTLNDLLLANHGRHEVSDRAARHLDDINRVVACFFEHLRDVPPFMRLEWLEQLAAEQSPVDLRDLSTLASWETLDPSEARGMQGFVNWLYQQVRADQPAALQFMHDLVRMTILLASHVPVNQTLGARPVTVRPVTAGGVVELAIEAERLRVGMNVLLFEAEGPVPAVGQGVIEDLSQGLATVRVARTESDRSVVPVRAQLFEQDRNPGVQLATGESAPVALVSTIA